jgi:hypothetical protein
VGTLAAGIRTFELEVHRQMNDEQQQPALVETVPETIGPEDDRVRSSTPTEAARTETPKSAFCVVCGAAMNRSDLFCHACGWDGRVSPPPLAPRLIDPNPSDLNRLALLLLCLILGFLGVHRFYVGKIRTGLLWLFTLGFLGMGQIVDLILIATGEFRDSEGRRVLRWSEAKPG